MQPSTEDLYRATYQLGHHNGMANDHVRPFLSLLRLTAHNPTVYQPIATEP